MKLIVAANTHIRWAGDEIDIPLLDGETEVTLPGRASEFQWPHINGASSCLWDGETVAANPDIPERDVVDELFENPAVSALIAAINDGSLPVGQSLAPEVIKDRIRAKTG